MIIKALVIAAVSTGVLAVVYQADKNRRHEEEMAELTRSCNEAWDRDLAQKGDHELVERCTWIGLKTGPKRVRNMTLGQ